MHTSDRRPIRLVAKEGWPKVLVGREMLIVGRDPTCDVRIDSPWISRRHCCLTEVDGEVLVRDLGSINGTWINGRRVESGRLRAGDELSIATFSFSVVDGWFEDPAADPIRSTQIATLPQTRPPDPC
jgi:pSer/pThr/pTyr-binding forkhead associated (FHA) protein